MKIILYILLLSLILAVCPVFAENPADHIIIGGMEGIDPVEEAETYPVAVALSGGGARGLCAIGILKAFEEKNIKVAAISGTSIGGIVGGLYACGYNADELVRFIDQINFSELFSNEPARSTMFLTQRQEKDQHILSMRFDKLKPHIPQALTAGQQLTNLLTNLTVKSDYLSDGKFSRLPIPFKTICTDIVSGEAVIIDHGPLAEAMRATMAFPLAFTGVEDHGHILMDGGMLIPIPVEIARKMSDTIDYVVAINTTTPLLPKDEINTPIDIANQVTSIMTADKLAWQLKQADFVITPPLENYAGTDFDLKDTLIAIGYRTGLKVADEIIERIKHKHTSRRYLITDLDIQPEGHPLAEKLRRVMLDMNLTRKDVIDHLKECIRDDHLFKIEADLMPDMSVNVNVSGYRRAGLRIKLFSEIPADDIRLTFSGNSIFDDTTLRQQFDFKETSISPENIRTGLKKILYLYRKQGYDLVNIRSTDIDFSTGTISIVIDEAIVNDIQIENNIRTRDWFVKSYFPISVGQPYSSVKASEGIANIYGTDLFDRVSMSLLPSDGGAGIKIKVLEKKYTQLRLGWHWDDEYQSEEFVELLDNNLFGIGLEFMTHIQYGNNRENYYTKFKIDRIFSTYLTAQARFYHTRLNRDIWPAIDEQSGYREENKWGFHARIGQHIARLGTLSGGITFEEVEYITHPGAIKESFGLRKLILESNVENFDRIPFPETGKKHFFELQIVGKVLGGDIEFTRYFSSVESYFPMIKRVNYHPKLSVGLSRTGLPVSEKFYMGGMYSFSGFSDNELSGDKIFLLNQELRFKLPLWLYLTFRYDLGDVFSNTDDIKISDLHHGWGVSLALDTPIGPFDFGYGMADGDYERVYFNAGFRF